MFYEFRQNNSGGSFHEDADAGIGRYVIIEAETESDAIRRAERAGLYFNGCRNGRDCSCCGDRWYEPWEGSGTEVPSIYDEPIKFEVKGRYAKEGDLLEPVDPNSKEYFGAIVFVHYLNKIIKAGLYE